MQVEEMLGVLKDRPGPFLTPNEARAIAANLRAADRMFKAELEKSATPGPWEAPRNHPSVICGEENEDPIQVAGVCHIEGRKNSELIMVSRNTAQEVIALVRAIEALGDFYIKDGQEYAEVISPQGYFQAMTCNPEIFEALKVARDALRSKLADQ